MSRKVAPKAKTQVSTRNPWTPDSLAATATAFLEDLRARSVRLSAPDLTAMCDAELAGRVAKASPPKAPAAKGRDGGTVTEFHLVCADVRGVTVEGDGTFRSGFWVIAEQVAARSLRHGAMLALHDARSLPSYRQGKVVGYTRVLREMVGKSNWGVEFLVQPTPEPLTWVGDATGEKGYKWG